jgi:hypothetical protein
VLFHPVLATVLRSGGVRSLCRRWGEARQGGVFWRKAAGLLRFAEEAGF